MEEAWEEGGIVTLRIHDGPDQGTHHFTHPEGSETEQRKRWAKVLRAARTENSDIIYSGANGQEILTIQFRKRD